MFGPSILVAPVLDSGINKWNVYFPNDDWFILDGTKLFTKIDNQN